MLAAALPQLWEWSVDPPLVVVLITSLLYWLGCRRTTTPERTRGLQRRRSIYFCSAMVVLAVALSAPFDARADQLFFIHMAQHVLMMMVAAPAWMLSGVGLIP